MSGKLNVLTGATGLLGSHIAEQLRDRGERVRAVVRSTSDTSFLRSIGVELVEGDLDDVASLRRAFADADVVYHCAAKVGDWGGWKLFRRLVVEGTGHVLEACRAENVGRVLHVSSIAVYGRLKVGDRQYTEAEPLGQKLWMWDHYCRAKIKAEELCRQHPQPLTVVRPSWIYGPRDRNTLPRMFKALEAGRVRLIGRGDNKLNIVYAGDVADGAIRAANDPAAVGQAYNLSSEGEMTQRELLDLLTDYLGKPRVTRSVPFSLAFLGGFLSEVIGKLIRMKRPPHITRYAIGLVGRPTLFSTAKARAELGWQPRVSVREGLRRSLNWYLEHVAANGVATAR